MNHNNGVTKEELKKVKVWTILVEDPEDCPRVYGFRSLNKAISKAYDLVREQKEMWESVNEDEDREFFQYHGTQSSPFKYSYTTCKEIIIESLCQDYPQHLVWSESFSDYSTYSIEIEGHGL